MEAVESLPDNLVQEIYKIREKITDLERFDLQDSIVYFDKVLKKKLVEKFGSTRLLQQVDVWQALVGGTIEERTDITDDQYLFVREEVAGFVKKLETGVQPI
ncbi:MAG: hypothetical protein RLZZ360_612 [Candidatus Parcubacteria bacterium]|jgi:hypothetical protein